MNCKNLKRKQKQYKYFLYCNKLKKEISFNNCTECKYKEFKEYKPIKKRSYSLAKKEKQRYSIIVKDLDKCVICGKKPVNKHEIFFGTGKRQLSIKYGLVIPLCTSRHHDQTNCRGIHFEPDLCHYWQKIGQEAFEKHYPDLNFLEIFGKNYK